MIWAQMTSWTGLTLTTDNIFIAGELFDSDRATRMQLAGRNADFSPHAKFAAIGKLGGGIMKHDAGIDLAQEAFSGGPVRLPS